MKQRIENNMKLTEKEIKILKIITDAKHTEIIYSKAHLETLIYYRDKLGEIVKIILDDEDLNKSNNKNSIFVEYIRFILLRLNLEPEQLDNMLFALDEKIKSK